jgi:hypothetical protein
MYDSSGKVAWTDALIEQNRQGGIWYLQSRVKRRREVAVGNFPL